MHFDNTTTVGVVVNTELTGVNHQALATKWPFSTSLCTHFHCLSKLNLNAVLVKSSDLQWLVLKERKSIAGWVAQTGAKVQKRVEAENSWHSSCKFNCVECVHLWLPTSRSDCNVWFWLACVGHLGIYHLSLDPIKTFSLDKLLKWTHLRNLSIYVLPW